MVRMVDMQGPIFLAGELHVAMSGRLGILVQVDLRIPYVPGIAKKFAKTET